MTFVERQLRQQSGFGGSGVPGFSGVLTHLRPRPAAADGVIRPSAVMALLKELATSHDSQYRF